MILRRGINFGGWLSQCDHTKERYDSFINKSDVAQVASWAFDHIRLPFDYHLIEADDGRDIESGYSYLDKIVKWCSEYKLDIILDLHKAPGYDFNDAGTSKGNTLFTNDLLKERFLKIWEKIAKRYGKFTNVAFELLNEVVEEEAASPWNDLISQVISVIRKYALESLIIYGGIQWNSARTLKLLSPPKDKNILFTFHLYEPLIFTHQKAPWVPNMVMDKDIAYPETMEYYTEFSRQLGDKGKDVTESKSLQMGIGYIEELVQEAISAAKKAGVKLYCGEFGVIDKAPVPDTLNWFKDVMSVFRTNDIHCAIWTYKQMDFGLVDAHYDLIRKALISDYIK